jgi:hypothetical protein
MIMEWRVINNDLNYSSANLGGINVCTAANVGLEFQALQGIISRPVKHTPTEVYIFISARRTNYLDKKVTIVDVMIYNA